ncbi:hypothetical protein QFZ75_003682 [Streptomyces sp. V3I8]|uniref:hypothetical protein n=1 Tax=Streptomyces sp. V3I8 TaxID=3042279 RepID=UPI002781E472|nr:hypothetical protein [Streptomyces sp. V3I8]MDQ1037266.1 hypothetical protein [Streptomyces sp. V3I8]
MAETIHLKGEGGAVHAFDLPLPEPIEQRLERGALRRVNADGSPYYTAEGEGVRPTAASERPGKTAAKPEWVDWAVAVHGLERAEAEGMTKAALAELPDQPREVPPAADGRPSEDAEKSAWVGYVVRLGKLSAEDAVNYTKADLIDLAN